MKQKLFLPIAFLFAMLLQTVTAVADTVELPDSGSVTFDWDDAELTNCSSENDGANIGSTYAGSSAVFTISNPTSQGYIVSFQTGAKSLTAELQVTLAINEETILQDTVTVEDTGSWTPSTTHTFVVDNLPTGDYTLSFKVLSTTASYAGNYGNLQFTTTNSYASIPGTLALADGSYVGSIRGENDYDNIGWIVNGDVASYTFINKEQGVYTFTSEINGYCSDGTITFTVTDVTTGAVEAETVYNLTNDGAYIERTIVLPGLLTTGMKRLDMAFANSSSWVCNYKVITMTKYADAIANMTGVSISGLETTTGSDTDWFIQLPMTYDDTVTLIPAVQGCTLAATATSSSGDAVEVTANADGTFTLPTPDSGATTTVTFTCTPDADAATYRSEWTVTLYRIGEISITALAIDGVTVDLPEGLNDDGNTATIAGNVYTAVPTATATLIDNSTVEATVTVSDTIATAVFDAQIGTSQKTFTLYIEGLNIYEAEENDEVVTLKYTSDGKIGDGNWSDGVYTLESSSLDGWSGSQFKLNSTVNTIKVPSDVKVKQLTFVNFYANYTPSDGKVVSVESDGATAIIPTRCDYQQGSENQYDLYIPIENHTEGTPITITLQGGGQPVAWFDLTIEKVAVTTEPVLNSQAVTSTDNVNHCVVTLAYDRVMQDATATIGNQTVTAEGGGTSLLFSIWNLEYNSTYTFTLPAGNAIDEYGNTNTSDITISISVGEKAAAEKATYDYVVSTAEEFTAAVSAVNSSNTSADSSRKTIFIKNGDYDFASEEQRITGYNVSLIGESSDGVLLHGERTGISNPVLNLRDRTGFYLQDLTVRNDYDWRAGEFKGVAVAIYGGNKTAMKNVVMQSNQDTQVTGERAYYEDCTIHCTVVFICGGGDLFYQRTNIVLENRSGNVICAPATGSALKWGYVFQNSTVSAADDATAVTDGSYNLGRPWQNEPRAYFLNTTMNVVPSSAGWAGMSTLPTHFYEYNSVTADGTAVDLSGRQNSSTHSGDAYTPVLTDDEATAYTVENVLGGTDSWLATDETAEVEAPTVTLSGSSLSWADNSDARVYVIFKDGEYLDNVTETTYALTDDGTYTVRAANKNGGMGAVSAEVVYSSSASGINIIESDIAPLTGKMYNISGQRVNASARGIIIVDGVKIIK